MAPHPESQLRRGRVPRDLVRRSAALLIAAVVIGGTPFVARALDVEIAPTVSGDLDTSRSAQPDRRVAERSERPAEVPERERPVGATATATVDVVAVPSEVLPKATPPRATPPVATLPAGTDAGEWDALRQCESNGNYSITNPSGKYRGAYQFDRPTWNSVAERHAPRLVGVDPAAASPVDQDAMAFALYGDRGAGPWPQCGRHLS